MSSAISRNSERRASFAWAVLALIVLSGSALFFVFAHGWTLWYGDAQAHLDNARRIIDSRNPGYEQIGTVWLPIPHLLMLPLVWNMRLWQTGLAGAIPAALGFVLAGAFLYLSARKIYASSAAGWMAMLIFALNPNLLYLQSTPMTESVFFAALLALLWMTLRYRETNSAGALVAAALLGMIASLTRYEGWFLIPFVTGYVLLASRRQRLLRAVLYGAIASLGPLLWLLHNWWIYRDALAWYNGPGSAIAIQGAAHYAGQGNWALAGLYFRTVLRDVIGTVPLLIAAAGLLGVIWRRAAWPVLLLLLPPIFYIWSIHSGGLPIHIPELWPHSYYNTRYGLAALPLIAFCAAGVMVLVPVRPRPAIVTALAIFVALPWIAPPRPDTWLCWKESEVNSISRRAWTAQAARILERNYRGGGILASSGDITGIFCRAGIPLRDTVNDGNYVLWSMAVDSPVPLMREEWVVDQAGDTLSRTMAREGGHYWLMDRVTVSGAPAVEFWRRN